MAATDNNRHLLQILPNELLDDVFDLIPDSDVNLRLTCRYGSSRFQERCRIESTDVESRLVDKRENSKQQTQLDNLMPSRQALQYYGQLVVKQQYVLKTGADAEAFRYASRDSRFQYFTKVTVTTAAHGFYLFSLYRTSMIRVFPHGFAYLSRAAGRREREGGRCLKQFGLSGMQVTQEDIIHALARLADMLQSVELNLPSVIRGTGSCAGMLADVRDNLDWKHRPFGQRTWIRILVRLNQDACRYMYLDKQANNYIYGDGPPPFRVNGGGKSYARITSGTGIQYDEIDPDFVRPHR
ncbi:hypothetical protein FGRMN_6869 [Fusarium graminum]|nr:hypothetical protein FGRMN_6869 [Fusarium graminum]